MPNPFSHSSPQSHYKPKPYNHNHDEQLPYDNLNEPAPKYLIMPSSPRSPSSTYSRPTYRPSHSDTSTSNLNSTHNSNLFYSHPTPNPNPNTNTDTQAEAEPFPYDRSSEYTTNSSTLFRLENPSPRPAHPSRSGSGSGSGSGTGKGRMHDLSVEMSTGMAGVGAGGTGQGGLSPLRHASPQTSYPPSSSTSYCSEKPFFAEYERRDRDQDWDGKGIREGDRFGESSGSGGQKSTRGIKDDGGSAYIIGEEDADANADNDNDEMPQPIPIPRRRPPNPNSRPPPSGTSPNLGHGNIYNNRTTQFSDYNRQSHWYNNLGNRLSGFYNRNNPAPRFSVFASGHGSDIGIGLNTEGRDYSRNAAERGRLQGLMQGRGIRLDGGEGLVGVGRVGGWVRRGRVWMVNDGRRTIFYGVWILLHCLLFAFTALKYSLADNIEEARELFGVSYVLSRASAQVLHINVAFILLPVCRTFISLLRRSPLGSVIPFDKNIEFHKQVGWSIFVFSIVHTVGHMFNFAKLAKHQGTGVKGFFIANFWTGPGLTGWIMMILLWTMIWFAMEKRKQKNFERFWYSHHIFVVFFLLWQLHGMFCMIKQDRQATCKASVTAVFWKYWLPGGSIYIFERVMREIRATHKTYISKVVQHPSQVMEVQIRKAHVTARAGQYIFINCPEISYWQYHPFTLTSAPEEDFLSVHIRVAGDWTSAFAKSLGCEFTLSRPDDKSKAKDVPVDPTTLLAGKDAVTIETPLNRYLPRVMIDGPFGSASEDFNKYETIMLVGAGIGVTPFASILKSIWYRMNNYGQGKKTRLSKVYFFWVIRDFSAAEWFSSLLEAIEAEDDERRVEIHIYLTAKINEDQMQNILLTDVGAERDAITHLRSPTHFGRPNWDTVFESVAEKHPDTDCGVFFCGPQVLSRQLHKMCNKHTTPDGCRFFFGKENF